MIAKKDYSAEIVRELFYFYFYNLKGVLFITIPILFISRSSEYAGHFYYISLYAIGYFLSSFLILCYGALRRGNGIPFGFAPWFSILSSLPLLLLAYSSKEIFLIYSIFVIGLLSPFISPVKSAKINYLTNRNRVNKTRIATVKYCLQNVSNITSLLVLLFFDQTVMLVALACISLLSGLADLLTQKRITHSQMESEAQPRKTFIEYRDLIILMIVLALVCFVYDQTFQAFSVKVITSNYIQNVSKMWLLNTGTIIICYFLFYRVSFSNKETPYYLALSVILISFMLMLANYIHYFKTGLIILISIGEYFMFVILDRFIIVFSKGSKGYASFISSLSDAIIYSSASFLGVFEFIFHFGINTTKILNICFVVGIISAIIILICFKNLGVNGNEYSSNKVTRYSKSNR